MMSSLTIREMQSTDLDFAAQCTEKEGWLDETREQFEGFLAHDPSGCLVAEWEGERFGICVATPYQSAGWLGELIVVKERRGQGIGRHLMDHALEYLHQRRVRDIFLDGMPEAVPLYERYGFRRICRSLRFTGMVRGARHLAVRGMQARDLGIVCEMDRRSFGQDRSDFLQRRLSASPELCQVLEQDGEVVGYAMGRSGRGGLSIGPCVLHSRDELAGALFEAVAAEAPESRVRLGVLETNTHALTVIRSLGLTVESDSPWRMLLGQSPAVGTSNECFAIGSPAKG
jgi:ribosomal protein S18 acetylase RimI-like enzyme